MGSKTHALTMTQGKFGHEFLEFEFRPDGKVRGLLLSLLHVLPGLVISMLCQALSARGVV